MPEENLSPPPPPPVNGSDPNAWKVTLAGGDQARAKALERFESPDKMFEHLTAEPAKPQEIDWRKAMAGDDADEMKYLERFPDLATARKSWREADKRVNEAGRIRVPGEGATEAELSEWRKAIGVAEKPDAYEIKAKPADGYEVTDDDKGVVGRLQGKLHEALSKGAKAGDLMNIATQFYYDEAAQAAVATEDRAADAAAETEGKLKDLWGGKYEENVRWAVAGARHFFPGKSDEEFDNFLGLTLSTGEKVGDNEAFLRMFAAVGRQFAEDPHFLALKENNKGFDPVKRKEEIMKLRETNPKQYASREVQDELDKINAGLVRKQEQAAAA